MYDGNQTKKEPSQPYLQLRLEPKISTNDSLAAASEKDDVTFKQLLFGRVLIRHFVFHEWLE